MPLLPPSAATRVHPIGCALVGHTSRHNDTSSTRQRQRSDGTGEGGGGGRGYHESVDEFVRCKSCIVDDVKLVLLIEANEELCVPTYADIFATKTLRSAYNTPQQREGIDRYNSVLGHDFCNKQQVTEYNLVRHFFVPGLERYTLSKVSHPVQQTQHWQRSVLGTASNVLLSIAQIDNSIRY